MKTVWAYVYERRQVPLAWGLCTAVFGFVTWLYGLPAEGAAYGAALALAGCGLLLGAGWPGWHRRVQAVRQAAADPDRDHIPLPGALSGGLEDAYRQALEAQIARAAALDRDRRALRDDLLDYFAVWAHQVKTPLAALRLLVQNRADPAELEPELFRIGEYVDAAMGYLRLGAGSKDLALSPTALDPVVRRSLRRYARMFILGRLRLVYTGAPEEARPVTDPKWVGFILEQLLSNAVKYTPPGGTVTVQADGHTLQVSDTGPGVSPDDLPRLFEKGYTGANGRAAGAVSSGLGLYLCARAAERMGCTLKARSTPGQGCTFVLTFPGPRAFYE